MTEFVKRRIRQREMRIRDLSERIRVLQRERAELRAEVRAYEDVMDNLNSAKNPGEPIAQSNSESTQSSEGARISTAWRSMLTEVAKSYPNSITLDGFRTIAKKIKHEMSDDSLRSQLSTYTSRGWLERTAIGRYRINIDAAQALGLPFAGPNTESDQLEEDEDFSELI